ncbi:Fe-S cluster assembly ATPase SufC [Flavilitoribacter nigricans]|uniref:Fe-S cluster assembly ATPase SufC n=1 Tax=Flavilitoribacter nigricans (strain ATCC 23147 / DSM 23189 / NBRC 102662 / NCIMB 1420 / SS-2) TaxID=1122177 RepID=A0A2D0N983_FLAN2|nr:Fe-S cluster assembly ATPase SufC [Flavilitoribacter nigricans]PHN04930.1 Fe-S cluster assembly ATPase SufC [Flavilitoribacter nigricans DSM 23189 = NBRC 102662]
MLSIKDLKVNIEDKAILRGLNLDIKPGEIHAIMGPNGSGKSTLANVLAGREEYEVTDGSVTFEGEDLLDMDVDERAQKGVFLAFQYPVEIPGVSTATFLKSAVNAVREARGEEELKSIDMLKLLREKTAMVGMDQKFLQRSLNEGFSGGEKKRNEMLQMALLEPKLAVLDETDSGLDIDALKIVADVVNQMRDANRSFLIVTHYQRLLNYIVPDHVHVLVNGRIVKSGDKSLALKLEDQGYDWVKGEAALAE